MTRPKGLRCSPSSRRRSGGGLTVGRPFAHWRSRGFGGAIVDAHRAIHGARARDNLRTFVPLELVAEPAAHPTQGEAAELEEVVAAALSLAPAQRDLLMRRMAGETLDEIREGVGGARCTWFRRGELAREALAKRLTIPRRQRLAA